MNISISELLDNENLCIMHTEIYKHPSE